MFITTEFNVIGSIELKIRKLSIFFHTGGFLSSLGEKAFFLASFVTNKTPTV